MLSALGYAYAVSGRKDRAQGIVEQLRQRARQRYIAPYFLAIVYARLGDKERALESLEQDFRERSIVVTWLKTDPRLDDLRSTAGFRSLVRRAAGAWALRSGDDKPL
jgi:tetratricopeptide (TPR) repeat protein